MKKLFYLCLLSISVIACKTSNKESKEVSDAEVVGTFAQEMLNINQGLKKPGDVADLLALAGTDFMPELVNDPMNHVQYLGDNVKTAANIGVYMADGLYQIAFDKKYEGYLSIAASKQLAEAIGLGSIMNEIILDKYGDGEYPSDSILQTIRLGLERSELLLNEKDQAQIFAAMLFGNYIEKINIVLTNIFDYPVELPQEAKLLIVRDLVIVAKEQLNLMPDVISIVDKYKQDENSPILADLKEIQTIREKYALSSGEIAKLKPEMIFENEGFLALYDKIKEIRASIVSVQ